MTHLGYWAKHTSFLGTQQLRRIHGGTTCLSGQLIHGEPRDWHSNNCDGMVTGVIKSQSTMVKTIHSLPFTTHYSFAKLLSRLGYNVINCNGCRKRSMAAAKGGLTHIVWGVRQLRLRHAFGVLMARTTIVNRLVQCSANVLMIASVYTCN